MSLLTARECADVLKISYPTLMRLKREESKNIPPYLTIGRVIRFDEDTVKKWIADRLEQTTK